MKSPLIAIAISSIYKDKLGALMPLPSGMATCTPDTHLAILNIAADLADAGGKLILSDLFRNHDMQAQSHRDYISGKKKAFSPPPGGSFHEAGRAFDIDLSSIKISLAKFWKITAKHGVAPIIKQPNIHASEAWHFDCRGSHQLVYKYYEDGKAHNFKPYAAAVASAILSIGVVVDVFGANQKQAAIQSCLIRLGKEIGNMDGQIGSKTRRALEELSISATGDLDGILMQLENALQQKFPGEFKALQLAEP
jgi:zinc D-Ala-D-Ala carboxypeptidase